MSDGVAIPLHLAVHVLGMAVAAGLTGLGWTRREEFGPTWPGLVVGGALIALSHLLAGAVAVDAGTVPLVLRAAGYAGLAIGALGRVSGSAAVFLAAPVGVHVAAGVTGVFAAVAAVRGRLREAGPVLLLGAGLTGWALADAIGGSVPTPAALLSVAASVSIGVWTIGRVGSSLLARVLAGATALVVVTVLVLSGAGGLVFARDLEQDQLRSLQALADAQARNLGTEEGRQLQVLAVALSGSTLARQLDESPDELDRRAEALANLPEVDVALVVGASGTPLASWDIQQQVVGPLAPVDEVALSGSSLVQEALAGSVGSGTISTPDRRVFAVGVAPIAPVEADGTERLDRTAGVLVLGRSLSAQSMLSGVAEQTASEALLLVNGRIAGASDQQLTGPEVNEQVISLLAEADLPAAGSITGEVRFMAASQVGTVGQLLLVRASGSGEDLEAAATRTLFVAAVLGLVLAAALATAGARRVVRPVHQLTEAAEQLAAGRAAEELLPPEGSGEVGRLSAAFSSMLTAVADREADLSEAADVEADLRRRLEIITGSLTEALVAVDEHGVVTRANAAASALLGIDDPVGRPVTKVVRGRDELGRSVLSSLSRAEGRLVRAEVGPARVQVAATSAPLLDARGRTLGRVYLLRDVTGEAQAERMKTEFLANISHELRTPLTPVRGYADVLARREMDHEQVSQIADRISGSARRLERVIGMLVDYAALEAGRFDVTLAPTPLRMTAEAALAELADGDVDRVTVEVERELPPADVDPALFRRQLVELIDNALKFTDAEVVVSGRRGPSRTVEVVVRDHGTGLPEDVRQELGEGFRQGDGSATRQHGGLGLGLAMVRRIAEAMGGDVRFESPDGGGLAVVVRVRAVVP